MWKSLSYPMKPCALKTEVGERCERFRGYEEQDAVDFMEKESGVFLCYKDENCSGTKCDFAEEVTYDYYSIIGTVITTAAMLLVGHYCCFGNNHHPHKL